MFQRGLVRAGVDAPQVVLVTDFEGDFVHKSAPPASREQHRTAASDVSLALNRAGRAAGSATRACGCLRERPTARGRRGARACRRRECCRRAGWSCARTSTPSRPRGRLRSASRHSGSTPRGALCWSRARPAWTGVHGCSECACSEFACLECA
jgi:hypothetical protein